jgi:predicted Fe-Mo cluster-binding NifX family protein
MRVAVASTGDGLDAALDPRFGRCAYFVVVDTDTLEFEALPNAAAMQGSGAGIAAAQIVGNSGAEAVIAGNYGPNAFQALSAGGIRLFSSSQSTVREAAEALKAGQLQELTAPSVQAHFGVGAGAGMGGMAMPGAGGMGGGRGMGMGGGRGMGMGGGRGMGMGRGAGMGMGAQFGTPPVGPAPGGTPNVPAAADVRQLKARADQLQAELADIRRRLQELEGKTE